MLNITNFSTKLILINKFDPLIAHSQVSRIFI